MFRQKSKKSISPSSRKSKENLNVSKCADNFTISCNAMYVYLITTVKHTAV